MNPCPVQTEIQEHTFRCELRAGHDGDHVWWLGAPVNTWVPLPEAWTADLLVEDEWDAGKPVVNRRNGTGVRGSLDRNESGPGAALTAPDQANPDLTGADDDRR